MMKMGDGWAGWAKSTAVSAAMMAIGATFALSPLRAVASRFLPAPGQGPSEEVRKTGVKSLKDDHDGCNPYKS